MCCPEEMSACRLGTCVHLCLPPAAASDAVLMLLRMIARAPPPVCICVYHLLLHLMLLYKCFACAPPDTVPLPCLPAICSAPAPLLVAKCDVHRLHTQPCKRYFRCYITPLGAPLVAYICCCEIHCLLLHLQIYGWVMLHGLVLRLDPSKYTMKLKRSSEAAGNTSAFPAFAWANIAIVVCATIFYGVLMIPACNVIHQSTGYIVLGSQIFMVWFANWVSGFCLLL